MIPFEYDKMRDFESEYGTHIVCVKNFEAGHVYTETGELVFSGEDTFNLTNEKTLWIVKKDNKYGAIHPNGEIVVPLIYRSVNTVNPQKESRLLIVETGSGFGILDYKGRQVLPPMFESICNLVDDTFDIIEAKLKDRYMYFHSDGSVAEISPLFCTTPFTEMSYNAHDHKQPKGFIVNGDRLVVSTTHNDITDLSGKIICNLGKFNNGLGVATDLPWVGYMNSALKFMMQEVRFAKGSRFDFCFSFENGYAIIFKNNFSGVINTAGEIVVEPVYEDIIRRDWCMLLRGKEHYARTCFNDEYSYGNCSVFLYDSHSELISIPNGIYDLGNLQCGKAFARCMNFVGIITPTGRTIEPLEYERFSYWYSTKFEETDTLSPVRRNGIWGKLSLNEGFIPFDKERQEKCERNYISKLREMSLPVTYFLEYQKDATPCGLKWSNLFYIPVAKYPDFRHLSNTMTEQQQLDWLRTNGVTVI